MAARREVHPVIRLFRDYLLGRKYKTNLRFADEMSPRPGPQPILPEEAFLTISSNQYHKRDVRRRLAPPLSLSSEQKLLPQTEAPSAQTAPSISGAPVPGKAFKWTEV